MHLTNLKKVLNAFILLRIYIFKGELNIILKITLVVS